MVARIPPTEMRSFRKGVTENRESRDDRRLSSKDSLAERGLEIAGRSRQADFAVGPAALRSDCDRNVLAQATHLHTADRPRVQALRENELAAGARIREGVFRPHDRK